jgi:hypothetical protein
MLSAIITICIIIMSMIAPNIFSVDMVRHNSAETLIRAPTLDTVASRTGGSEKYSAIQQSARKKYSSLISRNIPSFDAFCNPTKYSVQKQQRFVGDFMKPPPHAPAKPKEILVYHKIGAGKSCVAITVALAWLDKGLPLLVMPASLIPGFRNELRGGCAGDRYISERDRIRLRAAKPGDDTYKEVLAASNARIVAL